MLFKAKPKASALESDHYSHAYGQWEFPIDADGYIHGWYVDGYIIGAIQESTEEYIAPDFWCPIEKDTLELDLETISKIARGEVEGTEHIDKLLALDELIPHVLYLDRYKEDE